jgi:hypothetical protein
MLKKFRKTASQLANEAARAQNGQADVIEFPPEPTPAALADEPGTFDIVGLPASQMRPDRPRLGLAAWFSRQRLIAFGVAILLLMLCWLLFVGPGRPALEGVLARLVAGAPPAATPTAEPITAPTPSR